MARFANNHPTDQMNSNENNMTKSNDEIVNNDISKISTSSRTKTDILRSNSPTFKRLVAVRIKLEKYLITLANNTSASQQFVSNDPLINPKETITAVRTASSSHKRIKFKPKSGVIPLDRVTYEKTSSANGNVKQKCSVEIWLPKLGMDDDDVNASGIASPELENEREGHRTPKFLLQKSSQSNRVKQSATLSAYNPDRSYDETILVPRVYHYEDYLSEQGDEQSCSDRNGTASIKNYRRNYKRSHHRRASQSTDSTDETTATSSNVPMTSKNLLANIKQTYAAHESKGLPSNSSMINELIRKYSMIKRSHQELTQPKLYLEKPNLESKHSAHSLPSPPTSDVASDHSIVATRRLIGGNSLPQTAVSDQRLTHHKPLCSDINPQTQARLLSLVPHLESRQISASTSNSVLPIVVGKRNEDSLRSFERSKTLDVVLTLSNNTSNKFSPRLPAPSDNPHVVSSNVMQRLHHNNEQSSVQMSKRALQQPPNSTRFEQQQQRLFQLVQYQNIQSSAQRYHHGSTTQAATNAVLVHLKYSNGGNTDRTCLIPD